jgi:hypothetical protein
MRFFLGKSVAVLASAALIVVCSCEKHRLGEMPEVQREHVELARASDEVELVPVSGKSEATSPNHTPTPAEFFPEKTPH